VSHSNTPDPLDELLQGLPRVQASEGFTDRVLTGIVERPRRRTGSGVVGWSIAAALLLVALVVGGLEVEHQHAAAERATRAAKLRSEHQSLQLELVRLRDLAEEDRPMMYLGGTDQVDLVLDLTSMERPVPLPPALPLDPRLATETRTQ
jgi:hypothetical protein